MLRAFGKWVALTLCACASPAPTATPVQVDVGARSAAVSKSLSCSANSTRYVAPPGARTLVTPPPDRVVEIAEGRTRSSLLGPLAAVWASGGEVLAVGSGRLLRSRDGGLSFDDVTAPIPARTIWGAERDRFLAGGASVAHSGDGGATWSVVEALPPDAIVESITGDGSDVYAVGGTGDTIVAAHSRDRGATFQPMALPVARGWLGSVALRPHEVLVAGAEAGSPAVPLLLVSSDCGATWTRRPLPRSSEVHDRITALCATEARIVVATTAAIHVLPDDGPPREPFEPGIAVRALACRGEEIVAGGRGGELVRSADGGRTWAREAVGDPAVQGLLVADDGTVYAVGDALTRRSRP